MKATDLVCSPRAGRMARRHFLYLPAVAALAPLVRAAAGKPMRGVFTIMATPYTGSGAVDFEDLAREAAFLDRCGVQGMVWPQLASEYSYLSKAERMEGMHVLGKAAVGKRPALVLGVQATNTDLAVEYAREAERIGPDALIAMPPGEAHSLQDYQQYYRALAAVTRRPFFIQTTGGAKGLVPDLELLEELAREFPNFGYVKEEAEPVIERMSALARQRPAVKSIFSGSAGKGMLYEMRLGFDGTMPGSPFADVYSRIWSLYQRGEQEQARDIFAKLLLMVNLDQEIPGTRQYVMQKRGVFKTMVSRQHKLELSRDAIAEIEFNLAAVRTYFIA